MRACIEPIAETILSSLSADPALFAMRHEGESAEPPVPPDTAYGAAQVVRIADSETLRRTLVASGDPFSGKWMSIRSLVSCRSVSHGHDGQALVCLATADAPPVSPDEARIAVEECSHWLIETDWADGMILD